MAVIKTPRVVFALLPFEIILVRVAPDESIEFRADRCVRYARQDGNGTVQR